LGIGNLPVTDEENLKPEPTPTIDSSAAPCPSRQVLARIAGRWMILVFLALVDGPQRFSELLQHKPDRLPVLAGGLHHHLVAPSAASQATSASNPE